MSTSWEELGHPGHDDPLGIAGHKRKLSFVLTKNLLKTKQKKSRDAVYLVVERIKNYIDGV